MNSDKIKGASALFTSAFIYSTFGILTRQMALMFGDGAQTAIRFGVAFIFIVTLNLIRKQSAFLPKRAIHEFRSCLSDQAKPEKNLRRMSVIA